MGDAPTIAVSGATGTVGRAVVDELTTGARSNHRVRRLTRRPRDTPDGVLEDVRFSFTDPDTWHAAFVGVDRGNARGRGVHVGVRAVNGRSRC